MNSSSWRKSYIGSNVGEATETRTLRNLVVNVLDLDGLLLALGKALEHGLEVGRARDHGLVRADLLTCSMQTNHKS